MSLKERSVPAPGQAPLPAPNAAALLRRNASDPAIADRPAVMFGDRVWTHAEYFAESCRFANLFRERLDPDLPPHVAVLADNIPDYLFAFGGAALAGAGIVGLNLTRRGEHLLSDIEHTDCQLVIAEPRHLELIETVADALPPVLTTRRSADADDPDTVLGELLDDVVDVQPTDDPGLDPDIDTPWVFIFTSGTSSAPKAVICSQRRLLVTGNRMTMIMDIGADDIGYVCMPLFHSSAVQVGWSPSIVAGASVGLGRRFSVSGWLPDVRRYGATYTNYTGKPLAYLLTSPEQPDDADNTLRVAFGNEGSPEVVENFARRFGLEVIDAYGATEGGVAVNRVEDGPKGALGIAPPNVKVVDPHGVELPRARFDESGRLANADECVGEIVNTAGAGPFEGYYNNPEATERATRNGWYWSGDLGYKDENDFMYFAGRDADWVRVDGENFPAGPIEDAISSHPDVVVAAAYGVPDAQAGDQLMVGIVLREGADFDGAAFARWIDERPDLGPKWRPRYVRVLRDPPTTGTNKIVKRVLVHHKWRSDRVDGDEIWIRPQGAAAYVRFDTEAERSLEAEFAQFGRERFWDL